MRRPLLLSGFMATGKSTVGPVVAERAGRRFIDLDAQIESQTGLSAAEIFARSGEAEFRRLEREQLERVLDTTNPSADAPVVALGGGALLRRDVRLKALDRAVVVTLAAGPAEILRRAAGGRSRPLLASADPERRALELLEQRKGAYAESHAHISTELRTVAEVAGDVLDVWRRDPIAVAAGESSYAVDIGSGIDPARLAASLRGATRLVVVTDENVFRLHGAHLLACLSEAAAGLRPTIVELTPGEEHKHVGSVERIWRAALEAGADRGSRIVAFGGGVVSDIAGFAAATYMRGIPWVGIPTTLLAMVDASVGGKTGVDLLAAKNAVGSFHQPSAVFCDVELLRTESDRGFRSALAEVVKTAIISDAALLDLLEGQGARLHERPTELLEELVRRSIRVKARIVSEDERETGLRAVLNLGHTVGHAVEAQGGYARLSHGEAVSLGLVAALRIGAEMAVTPRPLAARIEALLAKLGLPTDIGAEPLEAAASLIGHDKKRAGSKLRFVVAHDVERVELHEIALDRLRELTLGLRSSPAPA